MSKLAPPLAKGRVRNTPCTISPLIRDLISKLDATDYSQSSLARALGMTPSSLSQWRNGRANPSLLVIEEAASLLGYRLALVKMDAQNDPC